MNKFVLNIWISRKLSYFVSILSEVRNIFYHVVFKKFSLLNIRFNGILNYIKVQFKERNSLINNIDITINYIAKSFSIKKNYIAKNFNIIDSNL